MELWAYLGDREPRTENRIFIRYQANVPGFMMPSGSMASRSARR